MCRAKANGRLGVKNLAVFIFLLGSLILFLVFVAFIALLLDTSPCV